MKYTPTRAEIADTLIGTGELDDLIYEYVTDIISERDFMVHLNALIAVTEEKIQEEK